VSASASELVTRAQTRAQAAGTHGTTLLCVASQLMTELADVTLQAGEVTERSQVIASQGTRTADVTAEMRGLIGEARALYATLESSAAELRAVQRDLALIARGTHIVALNALIEAARVGEAGAPFAIVALEVQSLAKQAGDASESIEARSVIIRDSISSGAALMQRLDDGVVQVDAAASVVAEAAQTQHGMLERVTSGVTSVSAGLEDAVNGAMSDLAEEAMSLQGELSELADVLKISGAIDDTSPSGSDEPATTPLDDAADSASDHIFELTSDVA
jgi:methyl-accepting chemotaxis protein